jgi:hypothetical protein
VKLQRSDAVLLAGLLIGFNLVTFGLVKRANSDFAKGDFKMFYAVFEHGVIVAALRASDATLQSLYG